ncbi:hypothetical protein LLG46_07150 [bacterium]|nr:hypothetical protein [bacterium]
MFIAAVVIICCTMLLIAISIAHVFSVVRLPKYLLVLCATLGVALYIILGPLQLQKLSAYASYLGVVGLNTRDTRALLGAPSHVIAGFQETTWPELHLQQAGKIWIYDSDLMYGYSVYVVFNKSNCQVDTVALIREI